MLHRILYVTTVFSLAFAILMISFFQSATVRYAFAGPSSPTPKSVSLQNINYDFPYPGSILPDSFLWPLKAFRDQIWFNFTFGETRKAELSLLFADKRIAMSKILFEKHKAGIGYSTLTKAEKYLEQAKNYEEKARMTGRDTSKLLRAIAESSVKHREVIEQIIPLAPEDARPGIIKLKSYPRDTYKEMLVGLNSKGIEPPNNPFDGE